jgi:hypothetical protein
MLLFKAFIIVGFFGIAIATDCISDFGEQRCMHKSEVGEELAYSFKTGDPCFIEDGQRVSFGAQNHLSLISYSF